MSALAPPLHDVVPYAVRHSPQAKERRKSLPRETLTVLFEVLDNLTEDPNAFPGRTNAMGSQGNMRIYVHPGPALEIVFEVREDTHVLHVWHIVAPQVPVTKPVFISYSHLDGEWLDKLQLMLKPLVRVRKISVWAAIRCWKRWSTTCRSWT